MSDKETVQGKTGLSSGKTAHYMPDVGSLSIYAPSNKAQTLDSIESTNSTSNQAPQLAKRQEQESKEESFQRLKSCSSKSALHDFFDQNSKSCDIKQELNCIDAIS